MPISPFVAQLRQKVGTDLLMLAGISAVVLNDHREILLVKPNLTSQWMPIGGMIEPAAAAVREVLEETGVHVKPQKIAGVYAGPHVVYSNGDQVDYITIVFLCSAISGDPHPADGENLEAKYFPLDQLPPMRDDHERNVTAALAGTSAAAFNRM